MLPVRAQKMTLGELDLECCVKGHRMRGEHTIGKQISDLMRKIVSQWTFESCLKKGECI